MNNNQTQLICVLETEKLHEADMAAVALQASNIPFYKEHTDCGGLHSATLYEPVMGPGAYYCIKVPQCAVDQARTIINALPIEPITNPDYWGFNQNKLAKNLWKILVWITLGTTAWLLISQSILAIRHRLK